MIPLGMLGSLFGGAGGGMGGLLGVLGPQALSGGAMGVLPMLLGQGGGEGAAGAAVAQAAPGSPAATPIKPGWLSALTGGHKFAEPGGSPTFGDHLQGIGHDMMQHYRGQGGQQPQADVSAAAAPTSPIVPMSPQALAPQPAAFDYGTTLRTMSPWAQMFARNAAANGGGVW